MPFFYLVFGYISTVIGSAIYNYLFRFIGGFEFEVNDEDTFRSTRHTIEKVDDPS